MYDKKWPYPLPLTALVAVTLMHAVQAYPLNLLPLNASDYASHLFKVWYILEHGLTEWNYFWYEGFDFLKLYPPLTYLLAALLGSVLGSVGGLNLVANIAWILLPFAFYLLLREYKLSDIQTTVALVLFSTVPVAAAYLRNGNIPFVLSLLFAILFWRSLKRHLEKKEGAASSIVLLTMVALTHVFMFAAVLLSTGAWFVGSYFSTNSVKKVGFILGITAVIIAFWYLPFVSSAFVGREGSISLVNDPIIESVHTSSQRLTTMGIPPEIFLFVAVLTVIFLIAALRGPWSPVTREFLPVLALTALLFLFLDYKRLAVLAIVPISLIVSQAFVNKLERYWSVLVAVSFAAALFFSISFIPMPSLPVVGDRAVLYPGSSACDGCSFYEAFLIPMNGNSYVDGWFVQAQNTPDLAGRKLPNLFKLQRPLSLSTEEFNSLAQSYMLNYLIVRQSAEDYVEYFDNNPRFVRQRTASGFVVYEASPLFTYVEIDGQPVNATVIRAPNSLTAQFPCTPGVVLVKESYDKDWEIRIDGRLMRPRVTDRGLIEFTSFTTGDCELSMTYRRGLLG